MILMEGFFCLRKRPTPARVPPVPVWTHPPSRQDWDWDEEGGRRRRRYRAGEGVDFVLRLEPDLGSRGGEVAVAVGHVVELVRPHAVRGGLGKVSRLVVVVGRILVV